MDLGLADRVVIVTGSSAGIGKAVVELLAAEGAYVFGASRSPEEPAGERVTGVCVNLTAPGGAEAVVRATSA